MTPRVLVAGVGNIFCSDDGFGPEVARRLAATAVPDGVRVEDFGIRGVHLAYELLNGYEVAILIDAIASGEPAGTISVLEPTMAVAGTGGGGAAGGGAVVDAHSLAPDAVLALLAQLGGNVGKVLVVGCEPAEDGEGMGLSPLVEAAVDTAVGVVVKLIADEVSAYTASKGAQL